MKCNECKKEFELALELFNGELRCPICCKKIVVENFKIDSDSKALFELAETYFLTYIQRVSRNLGSDNDICNLAKQNDSNQKNARSKDSNEFAKMNDFYISNAVEYCKKAAMCGHPGAIVQLGFYYAKSYVDYNSIGRYKTAYEHFIKIIECDVGVLRNVYESSGLAYSEAEQKANDLRKRAAYYLIDMLSSAPEEFVNTVVDNEKKYSFEYNKKLILGKYVLSENQIINSGRNSNQTSKVEHIKNLLVQCGKGGINHSPLFGFFVLTGEELEILANECSKIKNIDKIYHGFVAITQEDGREKVDIQSKVYYENSMKTSPGAAADPDRGIFKGKRTCFYFYNNTFASQFSKIGRIVSKTRDKLGVGVNGKLAELKTIMSFDINAADQFIEEHVFYLDDAIVATKFNSKRDSISVVYKRLVEGIIG